MFLKILVFPLESLKTTIKLSIKNKKLIIVKKIDKNRQKK